jgi:hypothetical protein
VPLERLHSGCTLRDDRNTTVVNRYLNFTKAVHQYRTDSMAGRNATCKGRSAEEVKTLHHDTLNADYQLSHATLNGGSAPAGDFFFNIEISGQRSSNGKGGQGETIREVGQSKLVKAKLIKGTYEAERKKSAGPDDIFVLYTQTETPEDFALPDRSGLVDKSCWDSYFGPFSGRAYIALHKKF